MIVVNLALFLGLMGSILHLKWYDDYTAFTVVAILGVVYLVVQPLLEKYLKENILLNQSVEVPTRDMHDERRYNTYPSPVLNTWYHFCDSGDLKDGKVLEFRALGKVFVLWRNDEGQPVCQDAYCIHLGANLAKGGKVVNNCLECPFHKWKFASDGTVKEVPYLKNPSMCQTGKKLKTYHCKDWCGLVLVYYHADDQDPDWYPAEATAQELKNDQWHHYITWNAGFYRFSPVDIVDQAGDHAHFQTLHSDMMIPWTKIYLPEWFLKIVPLAVCHTCVSLRGDDKAWIEMVEGPKKAWGCIGKQYLYLLDQAGLTWKRKTMPDTLSNTTVMFNGPAMMTFNIPFTLGTFKSFVTTTPVDGGSILRVRTWIDNKTFHNPLLKTLAWWLAGISASQLYADVDILENKIRLRKPMIQPYDGPYNRVNAWMKSFYSESSEQARKCDAYKNDW
eukprot:CAMPEP_0174978182 /NCGR_PEP_ID=MMETSP0004_2-20121128/14045_1 /TAXON_ID=420556 /ORGANISM="Ochromonas sp., Strain CCMP1393" /LENGTH=446 /DNA_ID=CAMNT_0016229493 /DNA_START=32 /DNA_END=1372 /DNA_ORIENTATION=-